MKTLSKEKRTEQISFRASKSEKKKIFKNARKAKRSLASYIIIKATE